MSAAQTDPGRATVFSAFDLLLDELDAEIESVHQRGARSFGQRDYAAIRAAAAQAEAIADFRERVAALRLEWQALAPALPPQPPAPRPKPGGATVHKPLPPGLRTPKCDFFLPILRVLASLGGSGHKYDVLNEVGRIMHPLFRHVDRVPIHADGEGPRWRNTAGWARYEMVRRGLLRADSPTGIWEITPKGEAYLKQNGG